MGPQDAPENKVKLHAPQNLNAVRGFACLLVVALHVIGDTASNGLHLPMTSGWHYAMASIEFLRMPLFTALSGYLYASNRVTCQTFPRFWVKKLRRLGIPLVTVTLIVWVLRAHAYGDPTSLPHALLFGFGHLWYIQALIILFAGISMADIFFRPGTAALVLAGFTAVMLAQANLELPTFFSFNGAIYLAPYFLFGILLREQPVWLYDRRTANMALGIILIVLTAQQLGLHGIGAGVTALQLPAALAGIAGITFLLQRMPRSVALSTVGGYSYTIYLWHIVVNAAVRSGLTTAGVTSTPVLFVICLAAAVAAPIALYHVARRIPLLSVAVTGEHQISRLNLPPRQVPQSAKVAPSFIAAASGRWNPISGPAPTPAQEFGTTS